MTREPDLRRPLGLNDLIPGLRERLDTLPMIGGRNALPGRPAPRGAGLKGVPLYFFPLPLLFGSVIALGIGHLGSFLADASAFALLVGGAWVYRRGIRTARAERQSRFARMRRWPLSTLGGAMTALGAGVAAYFGVGHGIAISLAFAGVAGLGFHLAYGLEPLDRPQPFDLGDKRAREVADALAEADGRLLVLERAAETLDNPELRGRLWRISALGRGILNQIADRPTDLFRARKFLNVYLEGVQQVAEGYARTHRQADLLELEQRFRSVLVTVEEVFEEQREKLLKSDVLDLDVQIEVLKKQLEHEGIA